MMESWVHSPALPRASTLKDTQDTRGPRMRAGGDRAVGGKRRTSPKYGTPGWEELRSMPSTCDGGDGSLTLEALLGASMSCSAVFDPVWSTSIFTTAATKSRLVCFRNACYSVRFAETAFHPLATISVYSRSRDAMSGRPPQSAGGPAAPPARRAQAAGRSLLQALLASSSTSASDSTWS
jgi:hypothetical protein